MGLAVGWAACAQSFEVATVRPEDPEFKGRYIRMQSANRFQARKYTVKGLIGAAYNLHPDAILGAPVWAESEGFEIVAQTPGAVKPTLDEQMAMLRKLLADRFGLAFRREQKELTVYALTVAKSGPKLRDAAGPSDAQPELVSTVFPGRLVMPARNATMQQFASVLQRAILDRSVLDRTGLTWRYDFDLEWTADETQFGGVPLPPGPDPPKPDLFAAMQQQLGLRLERTRGMVSVLVVERVGRPTGN